MYYEDIMKMLFDGADEEIEQHKKHWAEVFKEKIKRDYLYATGTFEIPYIISKNINKYDAFIALGCVIKGETPHFDYISKTTISAIMNLSVKYKKPIGNGIITCLNHLQAKERSYDGERKHLSKKNKGKEAATAVMSVLGILKNESK